MASFVTLMSFFLSCFLFTDHVGMLIVSIWHTLYITQNWGMTKKDIYTFYVYYSPVYDTHYFKNY